ncbi:flagellar protein FlgN [Halobacillus seohaensis]|uniref:Flagellar protein FlgN n=1 Tax=Halobacillus seohaensis TaxID=447421 RepID=A0ABW2EMK8_9BACI
MTAKRIIDHLERLMQLHESLFELSKKKTEALKTNDTESLKAYLTRERKHVSAINTLEKKRMAAVEEWAASEPDYDIESPTISDILNWANWPERQKLQEVYDSFILVLADLKQQEVLNSELIKQSLQFVNMSLELLQPSLQNLNYGESSKPSEEKRSVFDSKA